jgi:hypothetical protein
MKYWLSCPQFTIKIVTDDEGIIADGFEDAAYHIKRFMGKPLAEFLRFVKEINKPPAGGHWPPITCRELPKWN